MDYAALAERLIERAAERGAQGEAFIQVGRQADVRVRDGQIEDLTQAASVGVGLRVIREQRLGFVATNDVSPAGLEGLVDRALELAAAAAPHEANGLPDPSEVTAHAVVPGLWDEAVAGLPTDWKIHAALTLEKVARAADPRIKAIESVGAGEGTSEVYLASTSGARGHVRGTSVYLQASVVASDGDQLQTAYWYDARRALAQLEQPEAVAREAVARAVRMLGAKKVPSRRVPVVLEPMMAAGFVGSIAQAASGDLVFKKSSFLAGKKGERIASPLVTIVDDGLLPGGLASAPFDGEGVPTRRTPVVSQGVLQAFLYDCFTARKAGARTTGNASRGYRSLPGIGTHNLYLEAGKRTRQSIIGEVKEGLYVTAMLGRGANVVTGDYSRGANGLWIRDGELAEPVQEVTVAGNLTEMLSAIDAVGDDLDFRGSVASPTLRFGELTVSGA